MERAITTTVLNGQLFKNIVINGANNLRQYQKTVDSLNVFPVPDGDTGFNMLKTIESGTEAIKNNQETSINNISKELYKGALMGARGNSGVILSQLFKGIYLGMEGYENVNAVQLGQAFKLGVDQAYKAVMEPVEGTILTVAREAAEYAYSKINDSSTIEEYFAYLLSEAHASLKRTPDLLPVLKKAGVIDSGGAGYIYILEGMAKGLVGETIACNIESIGKTSQIASFNPNSDFDYGYCTEFIIQLLNKKVDVINFPIETVTNYLETVGDSIVAIKDESIIKIHVHTKSPGDILKYCQQFGEFISLKIENMTIQHNENVTMLNYANKINVEDEEVSFKKYATVSVASGEGIIETFKEIGIDKIVEGGQTMNPSIEDFIKIFDELNAEYILVFPNNSNIILTAEQAALNYIKAKVHVVPTKNIAEGYAAATMIDISYDDIEKIKDDLMVTVKEVDIGLITYATRDCEFNELNIKVDDFIGIYNHDIIAKGHSQSETFKELLKSIKSIKEKDVLTIFYGKDVSNEMITEITDYLNKEFKNLEYQFINGKQDIYSFILSIE